MSAPEVVIDEEDIPPPKGVRGYWEFLKAEAASVAWLMREFTTPTTRRWGLVMIGCVLVLSSISIATPAFVGMIVNATIAHQFDGIVRGFCFVLIFALSYHALQCFNGYAREKVLGLNMCRMNERVTELLFEKPLGQHERHGSRLNHASIEKGFWRTVDIQGHIVWQGIPSSIMCVLALSGLFFISPLMGSFGLFMTTCFFLWSFWLNYCMGRETYPLEKEFRRLNRLRTERWEKIHRVITNGLGVAEGKSMSDAMHVNMQKDCTFWTWFIRMSEVRAFMIQRLFQAGVLAYGCTRVYQGEWEIGLLFPLMIWSDTLVSHLHALSDVEHRISREIVSVQLMIATLSIKPSFDVHAGEKMERNGPLNIEFKNVSYSYEDGTRGGTAHPVLRNITLSLTPGERVALIGPSGSGKTTLMKLLLRFDDPTSGSICVHGKPLTDIYLASYMRLVGYIPQQAQILDNTVAYNLLYGVSEEERTLLTERDACGLRGLMRTLRVDFGKRLNRGIDTLVGRHGLQLSGGQAQRVMVGAAVAKRPRLMVIDEATSSLDSTTEKEVQAGLAEALATGVTALIITHRLSTVRHLCDRFVVLKPIETLADGESQIEAIAGSFEELMKTSPTFRQLALDQDLRV